MLSAEHHTQVARLQSQLAAAQLDVQTAREQAALAAIEGPVSSWGPCCSGHSLSNHVYRTPAAASRKVEQKDQHSWRSGSPPARLVGEALSPLLMQAVRETVDAGRVAELEAAQAAAQGALLAEMDLLRRQKAAAEEQARRLETQARPTMKCALRLISQERYTDRLQLSCHALLSRTDAMRHLCLVCT